MNHANRMKNRLRNKGKAKPAQAEAQPADPVALKQAIAQAQEAALAKLKAQQPAAESIKPAADRVDALAPFYATTKKSKE